MVKNYVAPLKIEIINNGKEIDTFVPYKVNENFALALGEKVSFECKKPEVAMYYERQGSKNISVSCIESSSTAVAAGTYDLTSEKFTSGSSYNIVAKSNISEEEDDVITQTVVYDVFGKIPYSAATPELGMPAGNRFTVCASNAEISEQSDLPSGDICTVSVSNGTSFTYKKNAFEADGTLITIVNVTKASILTVSVKWSNTFIAVYEYHFDKSELAAEGEIVETVKDFEISENQVVILSNVTDKNIKFVPYRENFEETIGAGDSIKIMTRVPEEVFYYLLQETKGLVVSL